MTKARAVPAEAPSPANPLLNAVLNLSKFHRDHEKCYPSSPREHAVGLQRRHAADLSSDAAGAEHDSERRWRTFRARVPEVVSPQV